MRTSPVELHALSTSAYPQWRYGPNEQMDVIVTKSFPDLGRLAALRFLEFVQTKPDGVVSLPTGKTPEYFIKWVQHLLAGWDTPAVTELRNEYGLKDSKPRMEQLRFVQMDDFFPISPNQSNSFNYYIRKYYVKGFGLDPANCLLIDTSHIVSAESADFSRPDWETANAEVIHRVNEYCIEYERKIQQLGGIDLFIGGIGPDGHIAFNVRGSRFDSVTRLTTLNYESLASSAAETLGGMTAARRKAVITIGMRTITVKPGCASIIFAAGEAKAEVVGSAVQDTVDETRCPAHALRRLPHAVFYVTQGAAKLLLHRQPLQVSLDPESVMAKLRRGREVMADKGLKFLHTEPHHDDIMLGYLPYILSSRSARDRLDVFACGTSGFNSVSNGRLLELIGDVTGLPAETSRQDDVDLVAVGIQTQDEQKHRAAFAQRFARDVADLFLNNNCLAEQLEEIKQYLLSLSPGVKDESRPAVQALKGRCREFEAEALWGTLGWDMGVIHHLRLGFYTSDIFAPQPVFSRDSQPVLDLLLATSPDVVTVTLDPESSGPDTHYKVLQAVTAALVRYQELTGKDVTVWGYRNVWYKFDLAEADILIPVSQDELDQTSALFTACYQSQKTAEFPSYQLDGPFSSISADIWKRQLEVARQAVHPLILEPSARGLIFIKEMTFHELTTYSRSLSQAVDGLP